jgi:MFS family permease
MNEKSTPSYILPIIVFAKFAGTSLWFAGNAVISDLQQTYAPDYPNALADITASIQFGFIVGTFVFAFLSIADRYSPSRVFLVSALIAAFANTALLLIDAGMQGILVLRFITGFFLAGIYPVGMKIAADWYAKGLGKALGYLVGALVLGTAFPHFITYVAAGLPWRVVMISTSILAASGGVLLFLLVPDGPHRKAGAKFEWNAISKIFGFREFRAAAFGYFGHMWELYAFWAFIPVILAAYAEQQQLDISISLWSFLIIGIGSLGCIIGGYISLKRGSAMVAKGMLLISGALCLLSPVIYALPFSFFLVCYLIWGFAVVGDSPQFSTLVAKTAPKLYIGTALTIVNSIGFALTIVSIQLLSYLDVPMQYLFLLLVPGPIFGLWSAMSIAEK